MSYQVKRLFDRLTKRQPSEVYIVVMWSEFDTRDVIVAAYFNEERALRHSHDITMSDEDDGIYNAYVKAVPLY